MGLLFVNIDNEFITAIFIHTNMGLDITIVLAYGDQICWVERFQSHHDTTGIPLEADLMVTAGPSMQYVRVRLQLASCRYFPRCSEGNKVSIGPGPRRPSQFGDPIQSPINLRLQSIKEKIKAIWIAALAWYGKCYFRACAPYLGKRRKNSTS